MDQLPAGYLSNTSRSDYAHSSYFIELPGDVDFSQMFAPRFWAHHGGRLKKNDLVRVKADDGSFDLMLVVLEVMPRGGARVELWPKVPQSAATAEAAGVSGHEKNGQLCPRIEFRKATKWRVIGHDNNEYAAGFEDKRAAAVAMIKYMAEIGFTPETTNDHMHKLGLAALMD